MFSFKGQQVVDLEVIALEESDRARAIAFMAQSKTSDYSQLDVYDAQYEAVKAELAWKRVCADEDPECEILHLQCLELSSRLDELRRIVFA